MLGCFLVSSSGEFSRCSPASGVFFFKGKNITKNHRGGSSSHTPNDDDVHSYKVLRQLLETFGAPAVSGFQRFFFIFPSEVVFFRDCGIF